MDTTVAQTRRKHPHEVYFLRRLLTIYLPAVVVGMAGFFASYSLTFTANGLTLLSMGWVFAWVVIAAHDARRADGSRAA